MNCLFCKLRDREIPANIVYEDDQCVAFDDINPQAPVHLLLIPRRHIAGSNDLTPTDESLVGHLVTAAAHLAADRGLATDGYRLVLNCNAHGGQTVFHLHVHLLGGRQFRWPPG